MLLALEKEKNSAPKLVGITPTRASRPSYKSGHLIPTATSVPAAAFRSSPAPRLGCSERQLSSAADPSHHRHSTRGQWSTPVSVLLMFRPVFFPFLLPAAFPLRFLHKVSIIERLRPLGWELCGLSVITTTLRKEEIVLNLQRKQRGQGEVPIWTKAVQVISIERGAPHFSKPAPLPTNF